MSAHSCTRNGLTVFACRADNAVHDGPGCAALISATRVRSRMVSSDACGPDEVVRGVPRST